MPRIDDYDHAVHVDKHNGNNKWAEATKLEIDQQHECFTYEGIGKLHPPKNYKKTRDRFAFDVTHDGRHKEMLVSDAHLMEIPISSKHSGFASIRGIFLALFLADLNGLEFWGTGIVNACLEAFTKETVHVVAGLEFRPLQGHILIVNAALCGLRTSGLLYDERLADFYDTWALIHAKWNQTHG